MDFDKTQPIRPEPQPLRFHGSGGEYFRIWIVNLLLSLLTLGIYSAWAKVRRLQYLYRSTELAGSSFEYHGRPLAILKGRIIAFLLLLAYQNAFKVSPRIGFAVLLLLAVVLPILLRSSLMFRLHYSSYRGLRFSFRGSVAGAYDAFLGGFLGSVFTAYLAAPLFHQRLKAYQHGNSRYGNSAFSFDAKARAFYGIYGRALLMVIGIFVVFGAAMVTLIPAVAKHGAALHANAPAQTSQLMAAADTSKQEPAKPKLDPREAFFIGMAVALLFYLPLLLLIAPYMTARLQNLIWNHTKLGEHSFECRLSARRLFIIYLTNLLGMIVTLGFYYPWAMVRLARYRVVSMTLVPTRPLEGFIAGQEEEVGAIGMETAGAFDIDISF